MGEKDDKILIVDDDDAVRRLYRSLLAREYKVLEADGGREAIEIAKQHQPQLILLDIVMPDLNGYQTCSNIQGLSPDYSPRVIMVSANSEPSEQARAFEAGADDYLVKPVNPLDLRSRVELHFKLLASQATTNHLQQQVDSNYDRMKRAAKERMEQVLAVQDVAILALAKVAESRDNETGEHILRMRDYAYRLAQELSTTGPYTDQIDESFLADLYRSAPLHDVGKVGIPDSILMKPGSLTNEEMEIMRRHAEVGANILRDVVKTSSVAGFLVMAEQIARYHHEWWNGCGYPEAKRRLQIPLAARIVAVADVYDALTSERPYKEAWTPEQAKATIEKCSGTQFDPAIVEALQHCFVDFLSIQLQHGDEVPLQAGAMCYSEYDLWENELSSSPS